MRSEMIVQAVRISDAADMLEGDLHVTENPAGLVIFAHGSGSSRFSSRNRHVAESLDRGRFATLLLDLLTREEPAAPCAKAGGGTSLAVNQVFSLGVRQCDQALGWTTRPRQTLFATRLSGSSRDRTARGRSSS